MSFPDLSQVPLTDPPDGLDSNFIDPPSQVWQPRLAIYITFPIGILSVILRIYTRIHLGQRFGADDYFMIAAGLGAIGYTAVMLVTTQNDVLGRHAWDIPVAAVMTPSILEESFAIAVVNLFAHSCMKISLSFLYRRIFYPSTTSTFMIWGGIIFIATSYSALLVSWTYFTVPHVGDGGWVSPAFTERVGRTAPALAISISVVNSFTDFYLLGIPLAAVSMLEMSTRKKFAVSALFLTGLLICALSVAGVVARVRLYQANSVDSFWITMSAYAFSVTEVNIGLFCACIPVVFTTLRSAILRSRSILSSWRESLISSATGTVHTDSQRTAKSDGVPESSGELPIVEKGTLGTLISIIRGGRRPRTDAAMTAGMEMSRYSELRSVDVEYHKNMVK
ncbi:hypothetical protein B0I35DRAFT_465423 [Stachybotrys elegans]|uniref:Rhodopsin domain-containing protein n=1 Tax=Stachybotrys elegans TaxID=80388 RepID=A0A8K0SID1_9HYPO|nr:hypothetical protein B0I35DRAFT_465423 [Stachybotrys elegans]